MTREQSSSDPAITPASTPASTLAARLTRPLVLVGMMGAGKSSLGRRLAQALGVPFADADDAIEAAAKMPITEIFERLGEAHFRDGERRVIERLLAQGPGVIATGGGAFAQEKARALIMEKGIAIWLDCDLDTLVERVGRNARRPLLAGGDARSIITRLMAEREPFYRQAPIHVTSGKGPHGAAVAAILEGIEQWLARHG